MPTKKKRASFSSSAIPLSAIKESLESAEEPVVLIQEPIFKPKDEPKPIPVITEETNLSEALQQDIVEPELKKKNVLLYRVGILFTGVVIVSAILLLVSSINMQKNTMPLTVKTEMTPTPSPTPAFTPSSITFEVLNGSGVGGAAAKGAASLKSRGYSVVGTGNTQKTPATGLFFAKTVSQEARTAILADMTTLFGVSSSSGDLQDASSVSARLVIGVK